MLYSGLGDLEKPFLMPIEGKTVADSSWKYSNLNLDVFSISGRGTVATGRVRKIIFAEIA